VPDDVVFQTKPQIALDQLRAALAAGTGAEAALADAGCGNDTDFRDGITDLGLLCDRGRDAHHCAPLPRSATVLRREPTKR